MLGISSVLGACQVVPTPNKEDNSPNSESNNPIVDGKLVVDRPHSDYYRPLINEEGVYPISENRGVTLTLNSGLNLDLFEQDLLRLSSQHFSTDTHFIQEGQLLLEDTVRNWLGRQSTANPKGLNPSEDEADNPLYLASLLEYDFYVHNGDDFELSGITIGLAMNSEVDTNGEVQVIDRDILKEKAQAISDEIIQRMRENDHIGNIPIVVGVYEQSPKQDISGGVYILEGLNEPGDTVIDWTSLNESRSLFPLDGRHVDDGNAFRNFKEDIEKTFPSLNGIYARVHYVDDTVLSLDITVTTKFYGRGELIALSQYLSTSAMRNLPEHARIQITVDSLNGVESFLSRDIGEDEFYIHVFY